MYIFLFVCFVLFSGEGRSINMKSAGIIGRSGPQSKQPFLVAFFKASEVLLRSVRATGGKRKNNNRNKTRSQQKSSQTPKNTGKFIRKHVHLPNNQRHYKYGGRLQAAVTNIEVL